MTTPERHRLRKLGITKLIDEVQRLEVILEQQMSAAPGVGDSIEVQGGVSSTSGQPFVQWRAGEAAGQFPTLMGAADFARWVLVAAVEAERDAATIAFLREELEFDDDHAGAFLDRMRRHRTQFVGGLSESGVDPDA